MQKRAFQSLKRTFNYILIKNQLLYKLVFNQNMVGEELRHA